MNEECLICKAPLTYLKKDESMECVLCHKKEMSKTRCCKRDSFLAIKSAVDFAAENFGIKMEYKKPVCEFYEKNNQCIKERCPFNPCNNKV